MSTLRVNTIQNAAGSGDPTISGAAKAWVNFNGTGTVAIRASFNVSSITDNGTGDYTVNFTTALADANYSTLVSQGGAATVDIIKVINSTTAQTASLVRLLSLTNGFATADSNYVYVAAFR